MDKRADAENICPLWFYEKRRNFYKNKRQKMGTALYPRDKMYYNKTMQ